MQQLYFAEKFPTWKQLRQYVNDEARQLAAGETPDRMTPLQRRTTGPCKPAHELYDMGLVDEICGKGEGELAVERFVANHSSRLKVRLKVQQSRCRHASLDRAEGVRIVEDWVETAMCLSAEELRTMDMLILMQQREAAMPVRRVAAA